MKGKTHAEKFVLHSTEQDGVKISGLDGLNERLALIVPGARLDTRGDITGRIMPSVTLEQMNEIAEAISLHMVDGSLELIAVPQKDLGGRDMMGILVASEMTIAFKFKGTKFSGSLAPTSPETVAFEKAKQRVEDVFAAEKEEARRKASRDLVL